MVARDYQDSSVSPVYFGTPGELTQMIWPSGGVSAPYVKQVADFIAGDGSHRVQQLVGGARTYTLGYGALHQRTYEKLNQYWNGAMGVGPFVLLDPSRPNLLTPNQAACTSVTNDATDFSTFASGTVSSGLTTLRGVRSLQFGPWDSGGNPSLFPLFILNSPWSGWPGIPVIPNQTYTYSLSAITDFGISALRVQYQWLDIFGANIATTHSPLVTVDNTAWVPIFETQTAPSNAAYVKLSAVAQYGMNLNGTFETNVANWTVANATMVQDATTAHDGTGSMKLTPNGTSASTTATSDRFAVIAGQTYNLIGWLLSKVGYTGGAGINVVWRNSGGGFISQAIDTTASLVANVWNKRLMTGLVAPVGATQAEIVIHEDGTPAATKIMWADSVALFPAGSFYIDKLQFEYGSVVHDWAPGTGVRPVQITGMGEDIPFDIWFRNGPSVVIQEVS